MRISVHRTCDPACLGAGDDSASKQEIRFRRSLRESHADHLALTYRTADALVDKYLKKRAPLAQALKVG
jgi:hypothetical protein